MLNAKVTLDNDLLHVETDGLLDGCQSGVAQTRRGRQTTRGVDRRGHRGNVGENILGDGGRLMNDVGRSLDGTGRVVDGGIRAAVGLNGRIVRLWRRITWRGTVDGLFIRVDRGIVTRIEIGTGRLFGDHSVRRIELLLLASFDYHEMLLGYGLIANEIFIGTDLMIE